MVELESLPATRDAYDAVATRYAQHFADTLRDRPLERALLAAFAESVRAGGQDEVAAWAADPGMSPRIWGGWDCVRSGWTRRPR